MEEKLSNRTGWADSATLSGGLVASFRRQGGKRASNSDPPDLMDWRGRLNHYPETLEREKLVLLLARNLARSVGKR